MVKINVSDTEGISTHLKKIDSITQVKTLTNDFSIEAFSHINDNFVSQSGVCSKNGLLGSVHLAYDNHLGLILSPDVIWNTIMQGVSAHVEQNLEKWREKFVSHKGKINLNATDDTLKKGSFDNNWANVIKSFLSQIQNHLNGEIALKCSEVNFTTTSDNEQVAHMMTFMDVVKSYFKYTLITKCGIPDIEILGTREDWLNILSNLDILDLLELSKWRLQLEIVLKQFISAFDDNIDKTFWSQIYKLNNGRGSGSVTKICGWISKFFLYIKDGINPNAICNKKYAIDPAVFPIGITRTPFTWNYYNKKFEMNFNAGIVGIVSSDDNYLKPEIGWFVTEKNK